MKKSIILLAFGLVFYSGIGQNGTAEAIALEKEILRSAKNMGDPAVVTMTMYRLIALEGANSTYTDSLAFVYFSSRKYAPCFLMTNEVLKRDPTNQPMLELKGISLESLGALDKSMEVYQELYALSKNNFHGYNLAKLQLGMRKFDEAYKTIKEVEGLNDSGKYKVTFSINQNHTQQVELLAAIPYLKGLIEEELNKKPEAKVSYAKALKIQGDFVLAKEKLDGLGQ
jgi:tetratricopeptide (TPR) repeat protein